MHVVARRMYRLSRLLATAAALARGRGRKNRVREFLFKPVSLEAPRDRAVLVLTKPREIIQGGNYKRPAPRKLNAAVHANNDPAIVKLSILD